jgi:hypothetical protein
VLLVALYLPLCVILAEEALTKNDAQTCAPPSTLTYPTCCAGGTAYRLGLPSGLCWCAACESCRRPVVMVTLYLPLCVILAEEALTKNDAHTRAPLHADLPVPCCAGGTADRLRLPSGLCWCAACESCRHPVVMVALYLPLCVILAEEALTKNDAQTRAPLHADLPVPCCAGARWDGWSSPVTNRAVVVRCIPLLALSCCADHAPSGTVRAVDRARSDDEQCANACMPPRRPTPSCGGFGHLRQNETFPQTRPSSPPQLALLHWGDTGEYVSENRAF